MIKVGDKTLPAVDWRLWRSKDSVEKMHKKVDIK